MDNGPRKLQAEETLTKALNKRSITKGGPTRSVFFLYLFLIDF